MTRSAFPPASSAPLPEYPERPSNADGLEVGMDADEIFGRLPNVTFTFSDERMIGVVQWVAFI